MMKPNDVSQEAWDAALEQAIALFPDGEGPYPGAIARAITAAVAAEREACAELVARDRDRYMKAAGWARTHDGELMNFGHGSINAYTHNENVSKWNATSSLVTAIRSRSLP